MPTFVYTVDGAEQQTHAHKLTPRAIVVNANLSAVERYLIELRSDNKQISYRDAMDTPIQMHQKQEFITASIGPTPVS